MCGICGKLNFKKTEPIDAELIRDMASALHHRGPDEYGFYNDKRSDLATAGLALLTFQAASSLCTMRIRASILYSTAKSSTI